MAEIKYLDLNGLKALYGVVDGKITTAVTNAKGELKGTATTEGDTLGKLEDKIKSEVTRATGAEKALSDKIDAINGNGADSIDGKIATAVDGLKNGASAGYDTLKGLEDQIKEEKSRATGAETALDGRLDAVEGQIVIINGTGEGSIHKAAADAVAKVVAGAPADFDTLKEVAEWIAKDTTGSAQMQTDIATLKSDDTVEGSVAHSIKTAIEKLDATVGETTVADGNHVAVKVVQTDGKLTGLTVTENDIASAETLASVKIAQEKNTALLEGIPADKKVKGYVDDAVDAAKAAATTKVVKAADAAHLTVTKGAAAADGSVTYTIGESNIASADALTDEVTRAKGAEDKIEASVGLADDGSFTAPAGKNYINGATTVMDAVVKLDVQAKANADKIAGMSVDEDNKTVTIDSKGLQFVAFTPEEIQNAAKPAAGQ